MILDKNGNLFGKINIIDILLIILVLAGGVFALSMTGGDGAVGGVTPEGRFVMEFTNFVVDDFVIDHMQIGDTVINDGLNANFGTVVDLVRSPSVEFHANSDGMLVETSRQGFSSITVVTEVSGQSFDNGIIINGTRFGVGQSVTLRVGNTIFFPRISSIEAM